VVGRSRRHSGRAELSPRGEGTYHTWYAWIRGGVGCAAGHEGRRAGGEGGRGARSAALREAGREPRTRLRSPEKIPCPPDVAEHLALEPNAPVIRFDRLRVAGGDPMALMHNVAPADVAEIREEDLERTGLYELLRNAGIAPNVATQRVGARKAGEEEAEMLEMEPGDPVLTVARIAYDANGRPIEYGAHRYPAESYWFEMMLVDL
jgi:GntR family transcriptional regulator